MYRVFHEGTEFVQVTAVPLCTSGFRYLGGGPGNGADDNWVMI